MIHWFHLMSVSLLFGVVSSGAGRDGMPVLSAAGPVPGLHQEATEGPDVCLKCHGPFDKLRERTSKFVAPSGETISPHRHVPHDSKEASSLPNCDNCHKAHPVPPADSDLAALPKPKVEWCYEKCHHTKDFTPCKTCHPGW